MHSSRPKSNTANQRRSCVLVAVVLHAAVQCVFCLPPVIADPEPRVADVAEILESWTNRQQQFEAVRFEWDERLRYAKGSIFSARSNLEKNAVDVPKDDRAYQFHASLLLSGSMMRYSGQTLRITLDKDVFPIPYTSSFNGDLSSKLTTSADDGNRGNIFKEKRNTDFGSSRMSPLMMCFRPIERFKRPFTVVMQEKLDGETSCVVLADKLNRVWVDAERGFVILRWQERHPQGGRITQQADISYEQDKALGWVPKNWSLNVFDPYEPINVAISSECVMTKCEIARSLTKKDFRLDFPPKTRYHDQRTGESFIVLSDGKTRKLTPEEDRFPAGGLSAGQSKIPYIVIGSLFLAVALAVLLWRKGARHK